MFEVKNWGLISYQKAFTQQKEIVDYIQKNRGEGKNNSALIFCEHPSVITIGKSGTIDNVLPSEEELKKMNIELTYTNRGGDVTLHNPQQLVGYPIFDLSFYKQDLHWFLREIEECIIETIKEFGIVGTRIQGLTGVWIDDIDPKKQRKICAMGLHCSRWISSHGFALNVSNNLAEFENIIPCGIKEKQVTSILQEIGEKKDIDEVKAVVLEKFKKHFV